MGTMHPFLGEMVVFDLETLAVSRSARVYEIGAIRCAYDPTAQAMKTLREAQWFLSGADQMGREVDPDTMVWMHEMPGRFAALKKAQSEGMLVPDFAAKFQDFFQGATLGWCRGTHFDMAILENLFKQCGGAAPWRYDTVLDLRTMGRVLEFMGIPRSKDEMPHDALEDCRLELPRLAQAFQARQAVASKEDKK